MKKENLIFVVSAPSGAGKSTLLKKLAGIFPDIPHLPSITTRRIRLGEKDGRDYFFVSEEEFKQKIKNNEFVEWAFVHNNYYGTSRRILQKFLRRNRDIVLDMDVNGKVKFEKIYPESVTIFISPPSIRELERRLRNRKTGNESIKVRINRAKEEMKFAKDYEYLIINDDVQKSVEQLSSIIVTERCKRDTRRYVRDLSAEIKNLEEELIRTKKRK